MRPILALACALAAALPAAFPAPAQSSSAAAATADALVGLWKAKKRFGPYSGGPLLLERTGSAWTADIAGRRLPVRIDRGELAFELPNGTGAFRGKLERDGFIVGHWVKPGTSVNIGQAASPVRLSRTGAGRWRGTVVPAQDEFTLYLLVRKQPDGSLSAMLRNPERDFGNQQGVERIAVAGSGVRLIGRRGGKERDVATGGFDAENRVLALSFPSRGGSYDFVPDHDEGSDFYPRGKTPGRYLYHPPMGREDGWPVGTLAEANIHRPTMEKLVQAIVERPMDSADALQIHGLLIARHGKLVLEEYFHGEHRDKLHETRSAAKSLTAAVIGAAIHAGAPLELSSPVYRVMNGGDFPPGLEPLKRAMTLEHLLTMSSGYHCDDSDEKAPGGEEIMINQTDEPDYYRFTLRVPMATPPGENSVYCSASPNLALGMLGRATGENPIYSFDRLIARPLNIGRYAWPMDGAGNPYGGGGVAMLPRDFMKLGQLMLDGGRWQGRRIIGADFARRSTSALYNLRNIHYGYLWWREALPYKDRTVIAFRAAGAGGQTVTVVPELGLVVALYGGSYSNANQREIQHLVPRIILPAVREAGDDPNAPVAERDFTSPYGRSTDGSRVGRAD